MSVAVEYAPVLLTHPGRTTPVSLDEYQAEDGYAGWRKALTRMTPEQVVEEVKASGLRGRGGAGFPTGNKWGFIPKAPGAKYVAVNADESEPGTFKDRELMEVEPHRVLEGVALCCYAIAAETAFIYIRGEYVEAANRLEAAIAEAEAANILGRGCLGTPVNVRILVFRGAGAYICGEETALLESLEGRRPMPRSRPPFPAVEGLYRRPTVINNVETLANVPAIIDRGSGWYNGIGVAPRNTGPKIFCLSGRVNRPGNYELPLGAVTIRELIDGYGQGVIGGKAVKGVLTAGVSAGGDDDRRRVIRSARLRSSSWTRTRAWSARRPSWKSSSATSRAASAHLAARERRGSSRSCRGSSRVAACRPTWTCCCRCRLRSLARSCARWATSPPAPS